MKLSKRIYDMPFSGTRKLTPYINKAKENGKKIIAMYVGQPDIKTPKGFFEAIKKFEPEVLAYGENYGNPELRKAMSDYYKGYDIDFEPSEIFVTVAGSEALLFALLATCDPGDNVLSVEPLYTDYNLVTTEINVEIKAITTRAEDGYHLPSRDKIDPLIDDRTKAILLNHPNNPTGVVYTDEELEMLADIALENDLFIISDEVYREFVYDGIKYKSLANIDRIKDNVIIVDSVSKRYSACGARIGNIASKNKDFTANVTKLCQCRICAPTLDQVGAIELYKTPSSYLREVNKEYQHRRDVVFGLLEKMEGVICHKPEGAFYISAKLPVDNAENFLIWMLENFEDNGEVVMVSPIQGFYATDGLGTKEVRIAYVLEEDKLKRAMEILEKALLAYPNREV
ncbi:pyridoxal phosphate-dependent aminotransferase [uncultured Peptoniphilus sp.]|uniref:pyridoxal phosphate-dependent aminotransferase n=1 Tax=uncultured Peptoniphilus sp. TaxID=254354 RepID=UPI002805A450|nr:pyridoxal phosphate-dependent aminotransferase [uncultured Peptoniphilus sp.]